MAEQRLYGFCSKTRQRFVIVVDVDNQVMRYKRAYPLSAEQFAGAKAPQPEQSLQTAGFEAFACPCCETRIPISGSQATWHCPTCHGYHCQGTDRGMLHGACGTCQIDPASLRPIERITLKAASHRDF
jgi:hypothetical protein